MPTTHLPPSTGLGSRGSRVGIAGRIIPVDKGEVIQEKIDRPSVPVTVGIDSEPNVVGNGCKGIGDLVENTDGTGCELLDFAYLITARKDTEITSSYVGLLLAVRPLESELVGGLGVKKSGYLLNGHAIILVGGEETVGGGSSIPC